jgi:hypothetical protein
LLRGDYCRKCTDELIEKGFVWSKYHQNFIEQSKRAYVAQFEIDAHRETQAAAAQTAHRITHPEPSLFDCTGTFDGFECGSDADPGL